ncbi:unnamed protein product [Haemonchus placei]|uniref:DDE_Tnp_IS1595 domain-containing protein n=1 Tax=Haemonchus placei TaxID=6290 RepID=A0A0N4W3T8_HAEPC|nr:unnamed protein product [Haemonchus placei]
MAAIHGAAGVAIVPSLSRIYVSLMSTTTGVPPSNMPKWAIERNEESAVFALSYFWLRDMNTVKDKVYELNIGHCSVAQWEQHFRDVSSAMYRRNPPVVGGFGCTVEIDETLVARRKYNRGRWVRRHQWLFGGIERGSGQAFLRLVRRRDAPTLLRLIGKYIRPGTTIISDCWRAYSQIAALPNAYRHLQVNHQLSFETHKLVSIHKT